MACVLCYGACHDKTREGDEEERFSGSADPIWPAHMVQVTALSVHHQHDVDLYRRGDPCHSRPAVVGDLVFSKFGRKTGRDVAGQEHSWSLPPGEYATIVDVDEDGDFRLSNAGGVESGFLLRAEFVYAEPLEPVWEATKPTRFCVPLSRRANEKFGLHMDIASDGLCEVLDVFQGAIQGYNDTAPGDQRVLPGCFILAANDKPLDKDAMLEALTTQQDLRLLVAPRETHTIEVAKASSAGLGLDLECGQHSRTLAVKGLREGDAADHNRESEEPSTIQVGDRIEEVNGVRGTAEELLKQMKVGSALRLVIARPAA